MTKENPFHKNYDSSIDAKLVCEILKGDKKSLEKLVKRIQGYIFNVALKMFNSIEDAEDTTQEVLVKVIANLSKYDSTKSQFRTWLYRMTVNHFLDFKKTKYEKSITNFSSFFGAIEDVPEMDLNDGDENALLLLVEEAKVSCMAGMLMCLDREQRLIYIIAKYLKSTTILPGKFSRSPLPTFVKNFQEQEKICING